MGGREVGGIGRENEWRVRSCRVTYAAFSGLVCRMGDQSHWYSFAEDVELLRRNHGNGWKVIGNLFNVLERQQ